MEVALVPLLVKGRILIHKHGKGGEGGGGLIVKA